MTKFPGFPLCNCFLSIETISESCEFKRGFAQDLRKCEPCENWHNAVHVLHQEICFFAGWVCETISCYQWSMKAWEQHYIDWLYYCYSVLVEATKLTHRLYILSTYKDFRTKLTSKKIYVHFAKLHYHIVIIIHCMYNNYNCHVTTFWYLLGYHLHLDSYSQQFKLA